MVTNCAGDPILIAWTLSLHSSYYRERVWYFSGSETAEGRNQEEEKFACKLMEVQVSREL